MGRLSSLPNSPFEFVAFEIDVETETVLPTTVVVGVAFDIKVAAAENNVDKAENIPDPAAADVDVGPAAASYYSS